MDLTFSVSHLSASHSTLRKNSVYHHISLSCKFQLRSCSGRLSQPRLGEVKPGLNSSCSFKPRTEASSKAQEADSECEENLERAKWNRYRDWQSKESVGSSLTRPADCSFLVPCLVTTDKEDSLLESECTGKARHFLKSVVSIVAACAVILSSLSTPLEAIAAPLLTNPETSTEDIAEVIAGQKRSHSLLPQEVAAEKEILWRSQEGTGNAAEPSGELVGELLRVGANGMAMGGGRSGAVAVGSLGVVINGDGDRAAMQEAMQEEYKKLALERGNGVSRSDLLTDEAQARLWDLEEYDALLKVISKEEEGCLACRRNHRLLEQVWQTVSNWYFDQSGSFSQQKWASELTHSLSRVHGSLRLRMETYRAAREMIASLGDRYSLFLSPAEFHVASHRTLPEELKYLAAQYTGVGMELGRRSVFGGFTIEAPFAGSPAEEAGILGGERLLAVDGFSVESFTPDEAVVLLRGPVGSTVALTVAGRSGLDAPQRRIVLERRALPVPPLRSRVIELSAGQGGPPLVVSYVRLHYFTKRSTKLVASTIREGEALGVDGYILDLRNNPGGVFEEAIRIAGFWLDCEDCDVAATVRADSESEDLVYSMRQLPEIFPNHPGPLTHAPLVVIANRDSASASEVLTGALHDNQRALLVGEQTFGKGVIQYFFPMDDGSGLRLTVAKYLTPTRYDISMSGGLLPDVACGDYPRAEGKNDECIQIALEALAKLQDGPGQGSPSDSPQNATWRAPLPYRWLPPIEKNGLWATGK